MGTTREPCILELNPNVCFFHQLGPHWSPISCVLPFLGRLGPARAEVGLGLAVVGWFRRFRPSPLFFFAFPLFMSRLSSSHLIFVFISPSLPFILIFTSSSGPEFSTFLPEGACETSE